MYSDQSAIIAHRYPLDRLALRQTLDIQHPSAHVLEAISWHELLWTMGRHNNIGLLLLDLSLMDQRALRQLPYLCARHSGLRVLAITHRHQRVRIQQLQGLGVTGSVSSRDDQVALLQALDKVGRNEAWFPNADSAEDARMLSGMRKLSAQEMRVLEKIDKGLMNKQIASELEIALSTTKVHVCAILRKLGVRNRTQAVMAYRQNEPLLT
ncbi:MAG: response regulator transcription factor [Oceanospirillaceae bacterium]|nr:response regulator transcription factor [Oceanospirillaceae bacterium]